MEVEAVRGLSWEGGRGDMAGEAMEVEALRRLSWEGGRGDMQGVCAEGCVQEGVYQRRCIRGGGEEEEERRRRRRRPGLHLKSNNPTQSGGE